MQINYDAYESMLNKLAHWGVSKGLQFDDAKSIANLGFVVARERFDQKKGKHFSTFLYVTVKGMLLDEMKKLGAIKDRFMYVDPSGLECSESVEPTPIFQKEEFLQGVSEDIKTIVNIALDAPNFLIGYSMCRSLNEVKRAIRDFLLSSGWSRNRWATACREFRNTLT
jgi:uncharacterized protein (DUF2267 family)